MKIRTAVLSASFAALIASTGFGYAAYTGQFNIVQWAGATLGAATAWGTPPTGNVVGVNANVVAVPVDTTTSGSPALTAADAASTSTTGAGSQVIWTGSPTSASAETFSLNTYQGVVVSCLGTITTTTFVSEGTADSAAMQTAGTAHWSSIPLTIAGQASGVRPIQATQFTAPFVNAGLNVGGLQGIRFRVPAGDYGSGDTITCSVRTTLTDPANVLASLIAQYNPYVLVDASHQTLTVANPSLQSFGSAFPASGAAIGINANGNTAPLAGSFASVPINLSGTSAVQLVAAVSGKAIYVTAWDVISAGTTNFTLEYGTGTNCASGTTALTGAYNLVAQAGLSKGSGLGAVLIVPTGNALCEVQSAAVQVSGSLSYSQF